MSRHDYLRVVTEIVQARAEQKALVCAEAKVLEDEIRVTNRKVSWVDLRNCFIREWLGRNDETVHGKHDAAKLVFQLVISVARDHNSIGCN